MSWVIAVATITRGKWTETGETFLEEDVIEWIETDVHPVRDEMPDSAVSKKGASSKTKNKHIEGYTISNGVKWPHLFALHRKGDSMEPEFKEGDIIIISRTVHPVAAYDYSTRYRA